jgi:hypothetical protein
MENAQIERIKHDLEALRSECAPRWRRWGLSRGEAWP